MDKMMMTEAEIADYLDLLGIRSPLSADLETLRVLQTRHIDVFPFQSLSTVMGEPISLKLEDIIHKIIKNRRGEYCYELNLLFYHLLKYLGFDVEILTGYIIQNNDVSEPRPRTHVLLKVTLNHQAYISDVGYGGLVPPIPLLIEYDGIQQTVLGEYKIDFHSDLDRYSLSIKSHDEWRALYAFDLCYQSYPDLIVGNWYVSTHPHSPFKSRLMLAKTRDTHIRQALLNNRYTEYVAGEISLQLELKDSSEVIETIYEKFGIQFSQKEKMKAAITSLLEEI